MSTSVPWWRRRLDAATVRRLGAVALLLAAALVLLGSLRLNVEDWYASGDRATIELRTRDVGTEHTPLLGQMTRYGFNNPGPLQYWALAVPYRLLGGRSSHAAAGVLAAAALVATWAIARRTRSPGFAVAAALAALVVARSMGHDLADPWNPWMPVPWFPVYFLACWRLSLGDVPMLPVAVGVGSYLVHSHVQYGLLVGLLGLWAVVLLVATRRRERRGRAGDDAARAEDRRALRRTGVALAVVVAVAWGPALADQVTSERPNYDRFLVYLRGERSSYLGSTSEQTYPPSQAIRELAYVTRPTGRWITGDRQFFSNPSWRDVAWLGGAVAAGVAVAVRLRRRREREALRLLALAGLTLAGSYLTLVSIRGPAIGYLVRFLWPVAGCCWLALGWGAWRALAPPARAAARTPLVLATAAAAGAVLVATATTVLRLPPTDGDQKLLMAYADDIFAALPDDGSTVLAAYRGDPIFTTLTFDLELEKRGHPAAVSEVYRDGMGAFRVEREPDLVLTIVEGPLLDEWLGRAADGVDGLELLVLHESDAGRRELEGVRAGRRALEACALPDGDELLGHLDRWDYPAVLFGIGDRCPDATTAIEAAQRASWEPIDGNFWSRYGVFVRPAPAE